jgi:anti-anti-sigma regulatory factor
MLKVTQTNSHGRGAIVKLEGKLLQPWVDEVRALFLPPLPGSLPRLDLASLTFVDTAGLDLLRQLLGQGVAIESCSAFVAALLQLNHK